MQFEENIYAAWWKYVQYGEENVEIFDTRKNKEKRNLQKMKIPKFQKHLLKSDASLKNQLIGRSEIKEEKGKWQIPAELKTKIISEGGEALVFSENFGNCKTAVRIHLFDTFLFTDKFGYDKLSWKMHFETDYEKAAKSDESEKPNQMPKHENIIKNFVNIELFHKEDLKQEDCVGWITIMEKADEDLRTILKEEKIGIEERRIIADGIFDGFIYLWEIGIWHYDRKLENILLVNGIPKIIDFGLVRESTARSGYREMGYARKGSKFRSSVALSAATPGFANQGQFTFGNGYEVDNLWYFLFCSWETSWTLLYKPIDEKERMEIDKIVQKCNASSINEIKTNKKRQFISKITSIISIPSPSSHFCLNDANLTKSVHVSSLKQNATRCVNQDLQNVTKNVLDQKSSNLCVPISVTTLLRYAIEKDLGFENKSGHYSAERILSTLILIVYPRSMAGLNLNPNEEENEFQFNEIELLLERLCKKTYLMETGWNIIRKIYPEDKYQPEKSTCKFKKVLLHNNFIFTRPLTVTGAYLVPSEFIDGDFFPEEVLIHQMVLDRVDDSTAEYVIHNTSFGESGPVLRIAKENAYYTTDQRMMVMNAAGEFKFNGQNGEEWSLVNELVASTMKPKTWYLFPQAYSITLVPEVSAMATSSQSTKTEQNTFDAILSADPDMDSATQQLIISLLNEEEVPTSDAETIPRENQRIGFSKSDFVYASG
ncbi:unnamed protein product [Oikopleura dioica]|uniref:Protein kinase domain-containing protein n=1 Tax=Oikopleura dioica TaxID=34765 RepID=E4Y2L4_OIKDI|nr:unnamed protein product [Oikopleura dioica]